jgi:hypothetical protein
VKERPVERLGMPYESHEPRWQGPVLALVVLVLSAVSVFFLMRGGKEAGTGEGGGNAGTSGEAKPAPMVVVPEPGPDAPLQNLKRGRSVRGYLGVKAVDLSPRVRQIVNYDGQKGAVVYSVVPHSPAEKAGLNPEDVIVGFGDHEVESRVHLFTMIQRSKVGEEVTMKVVRRGETLQMKTTIVDAVEVQAAAREEPAGRSPSDLKSRMRLF